MLTELRELDISSNLIHGPLRDASFAGLDNLKELYLQNNRYNSSIPQSIIDIEGLKVLDIENSFLSGNLEFIPHLRSIENLDLDHNPGLRGSIPTSISMASNLMFLSITDTGISGPIPPQIGELANLRKLWLFSNHLTGTIPASLGEIGTLEVLELANNDLEGHMPQTICLNIVPLGILESLEADCDSEFPENNVMCDANCCTCCGRGCADDYRPPPTTPEPTETPPTDPPTDPPAPVAGPTTPEPTPDPTPEPTLEPTTMAPILIMPTPTLPPSPGFPICEACGVNRVVTRPDVIVEIPGQEDQACATVELAGQEGFIDPAFCPAVPAFINSICACTDLEEPNPMHPSCSVCGDGFKVSNYAPVIILEGAEPRDCGEIETAGRLGFIDPATCADFPAGLEECMCVAV